MTPRYDAEEDYVAALGALEPWLGMAQQVARQTGIEAGRMEYARTGYFPVVIVRPDHVVKLYSPWRSGHATMDAEVAALPGIDAIGSLDELAERSFERAA